MADKAAKEAAHSNNHIQLFENLTYSEIKAQINIAIQYVIVSQIE